MTASHLGIKLHYKILMGLNGPLESPKSATVYRRKLLKYDTGALTKINYILRDHRNGEIKAIDFRIPGFSTRQLRNVAPKMKGGGVGYYPKSYFVHVDTGRVRNW